MNNKELIKRLSLIEKIYLLESKLGGKYPYNLLEPFTFESSSVIEIQKAAKKIADHIGLKELTFLVSYSTQEDNVGGHIDLNGRNDVYIEIAEKFKKNHTIILAILVHEICHKVLDLNNIRLNPTLENEILTDITTVFMGFGKLSLNGCEYSSTKHTPLGDKVQTTTTTQKVGYLERDQFAFVYRLVSEMKNTPKEQIFTKLNNEVIENIGSIENNESMFFRSDLFSSSYTSKVKSDFHGETNKSQIKFAKLLKYVKSVDTAIILIQSDLVMKYLAFHKYVKGSLDNINSQASHIQLPSYTYIQNIKLELDLKQSEIVIESKAAEIEELYKLLNAVNNAFSTQYPEYFSLRNSSHLLTFTCAACSHQMRISKNVMAKVTCPKCNYTFIIDANNQKDMLIHNTPVNEGNMGTENFTKKAEDKFLEGLAFLKSVFKK